MILMAPGSSSFRSVRNIVIDLREMPGSASATGLHWQVAQATSLVNVVVEMSTDPGNNHQGSVIFDITNKDGTEKRIHTGIFMENGRFEFDSNFKLRRC